MRDYNEVYIDGNLEKMDFIAYYSYDERVILLILCHLISYLYIRYKQPLLLVAEKKTC